MGMIRRSAAAASAVLAVTAMMVSSTGSASAAETLPDGTVLVSHEDDGSTVTLQTGQQLRVSLRPDRAEEGVTWKWSAPSSSNSSVLQQLDGAGGAEVSTATLRGLEPGTAVVGAEEGCEADPGSGISCPCIAITWKITVNVE